MAFASIIAFVMNLVTLLNLSSDDSFWDRLRVILFLIVFGLLAVLSIYLLATTILRWIQDRKLKKE
jgi:Kef-type K+ transport system membrane component KefB